MSDGVCKEKRHDIPSDHDLVNILIMERIDVWDLSQPIYSLNDMARNICIYQSINIVSR